MDASLPSLFEAQVERSPDAIAVAYEDERLTYRELNQRANRLARRLTALGAGPETLVGICMERTPEMMVALVAVLKSGAAYLPLDPSYPRERLAYMLEDARAPLILAQTSTADRVAGVAARVIPLEQDPPSIADGNGGNLERTPGPEDLAYVIYTSGSTGTPKGAMIHHRGLSNYLCWAADYYRVAEGTGALVHSPIGFDLTITTLFAPLLVGQRVVLLREDPGLQELSRALATGEDFSLVKITPTHLLALAHILPPESLAGRVRVLVVGGEMLKWEHIAVWREQAPATRIVNEYGPTETVVGCCIYETGDQTIEASSVPIGHAIDNMEMHLLDSELRPVAPGDTGEIYIGGVALARGYLNRPEITREKFIDSAVAPGRLYRTGDLARRLPDGNLEYLGRTDHQVKLRGYRIELGEVEVALARHPAVRDCVVVARKDPKGEHSLAAYVVGNETTPSDGELRRFLRQSLPMYMVPSWFVVLDALPLTANGKVDRDALPSPERGPRSDALKAPQDSLERQLVEVWEAVLGVRPISLDDDFFAIGGNSLRAVLVAARLEELRGGHIPPSLIAEHSTIEELAVVIHRLEAEPRDSTVVEVQAKGSLPPLYLVPGIGGLVMGASYLARRLGFDQPFYGLQAKGLRHAENAFASIEEMASYYIDAIQAFHTDDPIFIAGYSFGGVVAFEIGRQLLAAGKRVGMVAILDTVAPGRHRFHPVSFARNLPYWVTDFVLRRKPREVGRDVLKKVKGASRRCINGLRRAVNLEPIQEEITERVDLPGELPERYRRVAARHYEALLRYQPQTYPGKITLFCTRAQPLLRAYPENGWGPFAAGGVEVHQIEGNHLNFLEEPHVRVLAEKMRASLEESRRTMGSKDGDPAPGDDESYPP